MKRNNKLNGNQRDVLGVVVIIDEMDLVRDLVSDIAGRRHDMGYSRKSVPKGKKAIETSSLEACVSGIIGIADATTDVVIPYNASYMFTCCKVNKGEYSLTWLSSLS